MGLLLLYEATVVVVLSVLSVVAVKAGVDVYKKEKRKKRYSEETLKVLNDAPLYYERLLSSKPLTRNQDNIDMSILLAILNNSDLSNILDLFNISIDSLKKAACFKTIQSEITGNSTLKDTIKNRIDELIEKEFFNPKSFDTSMLFHALEIESATVHNIVWNAMLIEDLDDDAPITYLKEKEETVFYDHNYPEDESVVMLTKKPTNQ